MFVRQIPEFHLFRVTDIQIGLLAERNTSAVSREKNNDINDIDLMIDLQH